MYFLDDEHQKRVDAQTAVIEERVVTAVKDAVSRLAPARLEWGVGRTTFAVNRRNNREAEVEKLRADGALKGPVDHDLPVLAVRSIAAGDAGTDGKLLAVAFGYACHATTLDGYAWSGDWPGFRAGRDRAGASRRDGPVLGRLRRRTRTRSPRRTRELVRDYGHQAASGVEAVLKDGMKPIGGGLSIAYSQIDLPFAELPTRGKAGGGRRREGAEGPLHGPPGEAAFGSVGP